MEDDINEKKKLNLKYKDFRGQELMGGEMFARPSRSMNKGRNISILMDYILVVRIFLMKIQ